MHTWEIRALAAMLLGAPRDTEAIELWLTRLRVGYAPTLPLGPPIAGRFWAVPDVTRHHAAHASSAFALDLAALNEEGRVHEGNGDKNEDYASWDAPLLAVANGRIVRARDDLADDAAYRGVADPARANDLVLQVEGGQAFYQHLKQGSLRAKAGDEVQRGQELARVGNSGNGSYPHLHFALYEEFEAAGKRGWISVPVAVEAVHVVGLLDAKEGKPRDVDLRCRHAPLQESWVVEAG
jgi:murein DD-endopeptidase MepM/ murein hydrolase activator NlpD